MAIQYQRRRRIVVTRIEEEFDEKKERNASLRALNEPVSFLTGVNQRISFDPWKRIALIRTRNTSFDRLRYFVSDATFSIQILDPLFSLLNRSLDGSKRNRMEEGCLKIYDDYVMNNNNNKNDKKNKNVRTRSDNRKSWAWFRRIDSRLVSIKLNRPGLTWHTKSSFTLVIIMFLSSPPLFKYKTTAE